MRRARLWATGTALLLMQLLAAGCGGGPEGPRCRAAADCFDGDPCNGIEDCAPSGTCRPGAAASDGTRCGDATGWLCLGGACDSASPVTVMGLDAGTLEVAAGGGHACARTIAGSVKCWGSDAAGQISGRFSGIPHSMACP